MYRACISGLLTGVIGLIGVTQAVGQQACRPALAFKEVQFSEMQPSNHGAEMDGGGVGRCVALRDDGRLLRNRFLAAKGNRVRSRIPGAVYMAVAVGDGRGGFLG